MGQVENVPQKEVRQRGSLFSGPRLKSEVQPAYDRWLSVSGILAAANRGGSMRLISCAPTCS